MNGVDMFRLAAAELKGVEAAKRLMKELEPLSLAVCAVWLNACVKQTVEMSGESGKTVMASLGKMQEEAERLLKEEAQRRGVTT